MTRRPAVTLIEALMAIFVMAIGLLALLTLFPLGAVQMAQALKDDRTAQSGMMAIAYFKGFDLANDTDTSLPPGGLPTINTNVTPAGAYSCLFENPNNGLPAMPYTGITTSYPVYIDPIGFTNGATGAMGNVPLSIPRVAVAHMPQVPPQMTGAAWAARWFTMPDDLTYADNGVPDLAGNGNPLPLTAPTNLVRREGRYSWAYMVRRQTSMVPSPPPSPLASPEPPINLTVVVYSGRTPGVDFAGNPLGEVSYGDLSGTHGTVTYGPGPDNSPNIIRIDWTGYQRPNLRRGTWLLDARMLPGLYVAGLQNAAPGAQLPSGIAAAPPWPQPTFHNVPQGYFYRVVNVNEISATVIDVEVQRPIGGALWSPNDQRAPFGPTGTGPYYTGPLIVMENVSEVFEKGTNY